MPVAFYTNSAAGSIFCTGALPDDANGQRRRILIVPPFAEEMNKSRHVLAAIVRTAASAGHQVLLPDLFGTGDSSGDFGDSTVDIWRSDLDSALACMRPTLPLDVVGLRYGALLAADLATRHATRALTLLQPVCDGRNQLTQMLRLRLATALMGSREKETVSGLRQRLHDGEALEVAGYRLSRELAIGLESLSLADLSLQNVSRVHWIEMATQADRPLMPASQRIVNAWSAKGVTIDSSVVVCDQFWATQEIAHCPTVVDRIAQLFSG